MRISRLERKAAAIPEMGGRRLGGFFREVTAGLPPETAIVELGCWLGAGTAQLALGLRERGDDHDISIHCYDNFLTSASSVEKAKRAGVILTEGEDTQPWVARTLKPFGPGIHLTKGMLSDETEPPDRPISLYVDDASKYPKTFAACLRNFGPLWIAGTTMVVLMDYKLWQKPHYTENKSEQLRFQARFVENRPESFRPVEGFADRVSAAFMYEGGIDFSEVTSG